MRAQVIALASATLMFGILLTGCGGHSLPKTQANVDVCRTFVKVVTHKAPMIDLTGATLMSNAPISHQLRQDLANYIALTVQNQDGAAQAESKAEADCASVGVS
jgi:hypothetical protein